MLCGNIYVIKKKYPINEDVCTKQNNIIINTITRVFFLKIILTICYYRVFKHLLI